MTPELREVGAAGSRGGAVAQGVFVAAVRLSQGRLRPGRGIALGSGGAYLLVVLAMQRADAGRVTTLREVSILFGIALSRFGPSHASVGWKTWTGGALVVAGAILAAL
ncbi:MAG: hypothetical protein WKH64_04075 [Chloroflexia bacterium]